MTKILACGDIHTKTDLLEKALKVCEWDYFVFLGDACDDWGASQLDNVAAIEKLISLKKEYGDKFIWIMGNHDWYYIDNSKNISGHIKNSEQEVQKRLLDNIDDIELLWNYGRFNFTHAGISKDFIPFTFGYTLSEMKELRGDENPINMVTSTSGGRDSASSMIWARPDDTEPFPKEMSNIIQVVGHTPMGSINFINNVFYCDTLSRNPYGNSIGDETVLLLELDKNDNGVAKAINIDSGEVYKTFDIPDVTAE